MISCRSIYNAEMVWDASMKYGPAAGAVLGIAGGAAEVVLVGGGSGVDSY